MVSHAFVFVFSWYKVIIALSVCFSSGALQHTTKYIQLQYFGLDLRLDRTETAIPVWSVQNADCRPGRKCRLGTKCRLSTTRRLQTGYKMQTENLYRFFVRYVTTCHLTTYRASRNRFSAIIFYDYLYYCCIFLARFLITIVLNTISSIYIVFSLCVRAGWRDVCTEFYNLVGRCRCKCK